MRRSLSSCILVVFAAAGCAASPASTSTSSASAAAAPESAELAACRALRIAANDRADRCYGRNALDGVAAAHRDEACVTALSADGSARRAGDVDACAKALAGLDCHAELPAACDLPRGTRADGEPCATGAQCAGGHCTLRDDATCGTCTALADARASCDAAFTGLAGAAGCASGTCELGVDWPPHEVVALCVEDSWRVAPNPPPPPIRAGQPCTERDRCGEGLSCDSASRLCAKVFYAASGEACDGSTRQCANGICSYDHVCVANLSVGGACRDTVDVCEGLARCVEGVCTFREVSVCR